MAGSEAELKHSHVQNQSLVENLKAKLLTCEVSSLWYLLSLLEGELDFETSKTAYTFSLSSDRFTHVLQTHSAFSQLWASLRSWASFTHLAILLAWYLASWLWLWCLLRRYHALGAAPGWVRQLSSLPHWSDWLPPIWELLRRWEKTEWKPNLQRCELSRERLNPPPWGVGCW